MLEPILQSLREVDGVQGAMIVDPSAAVLAHRAHTIYDLAVLQQIARSVVSSVDSVQLMLEDWDVVTAHFSEGKLLLRSLRTGGASPKRYVLTVIADTTLNTAFLGVALRVAASKLLAVLEAGPTSAQSNAAPVVAPPPPPSARSAAPEASRAEVARTGLSWSGVHSSARPSARSASGSGIGSAEVEVADATAAALLSIATKALAISVGPMAKVFVKETVRRICDGRAFTHGDGPALLAHLTTLIDDPKDRAAFVRATRTL